MEIAVWLIEHWAEIIQLYFGLVGIASIVVKWTPTLKDDTFLKNVIRFVGKYLALNRK